MPSNAAEYFYSNVGNYVLTFGAPAAEYMYSNALSSQPYPFLLGTYPARARTGDNIEIIGTGFGTIPNQYLPIVQGQQDDGTWVDVPRIGWTYVAPSASAYTSTRTISDDMSTVDVGHTKIQITVPPWSTTPDMPVRVLTAESGTAGYVARFANEYFTSNVTT